MKTDYRMLPGRSPSDSDYTINGVRYVVSSRFVQQPKRRVTLRDRFCRILKNSAAELNNAPYSDTLTSEYGRSAAGKEA
jgi:hypothetical protein